MSTINDLPDEILCEILSYINIIERHRMEIVCGRWRYINRLMWREIRKFKFTLMHDHYHPPEEKHRHGVHVLSVNASTLESLLTIFDGRLMKFDIENWRLADLTLSNRVFELVAENKHLNTVRLCFRGDDTIEKLLNCLPTEQLQLLVVMWIRDCGPNLEVAIERVLKNAKQLKFLYMNNVSPFVQREISKIDQLKALHLLYSKGSSGHLSVTRLSNLETLNIGCDTIITDEFLIELATANCEKLRTVRLIFCNRVTDIGLKSLQKLPNMRWLLLGDLKNINIFNYFSNLEELFCDTTHRCKNAALNFLYRSPNFKKYHFQDSEDFVSDDESNINDWFGEIANNAGFHVQLLPRDVFFFETWDEIFEIVDDN